MFRNLLILLVAETCDLRSSALVEKQKRTERYPESYPEPRFADADPLGAEQHLDVIGMGRLVATDY